MKILIINSNGIRNDGITNSILTYLSNMDRTDMDFDILNLGYIDNRIEDKFKDLGVQIVGNEKRKNIMLYLIKTIKLIRENKYDVVHIHGSSSLLTLDLLAAYFGGCKHRIVHSRNTTCNHKIIHYLLMPLFNLLCTDRFAVGNDAGKWLFGNKKFEIVRNAKKIDTYAFDLNKRKFIREKYGWNNKVVVGHVGNFNYQKNQEFIINAFNKIKNKDKYLLVFVGAGNEIYIKKCKELVDNLNINSNVFFLGSITNVGDVLNGMDVMVLPSRFEGFPNVVVEWQINGLKSIVSSKVTSECALTNQVKFLSIDNGYDIWKKELEIIKSGTDRKESSDRAIQIMKEKGFEIKTAAATLKSMYKRINEG